MIIRHRCKQRNKRTKGEDQRKRHWLLSVKLLWREYKRTKKGNGSAVPGGRKRREAAFRIEKITEGKPPNVLGGKEGYSLLR